MARHWWNRGLLLWGLLGLPLLAAEHKFPPPDFESGYTFPVTQFPIPRSLLLQYLDVVVLLVALGLAAYFSLRQRSRRTLMWLSVFSLAYFGFYREGCVCAIGSIQNVALALGDSHYTVPLAVVAFFVAPIMVALFCGRSFCAGVCPHGAIQDLVLIKPVDVPPWLERGLGVLPFVYLGLGVLLAATGSAFVICRYDPFIPIFRVSGSFSMLLLGIAFLAVGMFVGRPYCRFLCPYGALLRMAAAVSRWRVTTTPDECKKCRLCPEACPYGAINPPVPLATEPMASSSKRQMVFALVLIPLIMLAGGWVGSRFGSAASRLNPSISLAESYVTYKQGSVTNKPSVVEGLTLARAERTSEQVLAAGVAAQRKFSIGGWIFGAWVGLVIGVKLVGNTIWRKQTDYEPDRSACFACGRCFEFCPQEKRRRRSLEPAPVCEACAAAALTTSPAPAPGQATGPSQKPA